MRKKKPVDLPQRLSCNRKTRDRKASRNSWTDIYNETTAAQTQKTLGAGGRDRRWIGVARQVGSTRGGGVWFAWDDMFGCRTIHWYCCIWCSFAHISWYIVLQKRLVCDCKTIVARTQCGDDSRIRSVQLEY